MPRCPVAPALIATLLILVPSSLADTRWTTTGSLDPFMVITLSTKEQGKATFVLQPNGIMNIMLGTEPPRVGFHGNVKPTNPGSTQFPLFIVLTGGAGTKVSDAKSSYKFNSKKDPGVRRSASSKSCCSSST